MERYCSLWVAKYQYLSGVLRFCHAGGYGKYWRYSDSYQSGIYQFDVGLLFEENVNEAWARQCKCSVEQFSGNTIMEKYPGIQHTELFQALRACMSNGKPKRLENDFVYPDGSKGFYDLSIQPVPEGLLILSMDVSERRKRELEKEQYLKELQEVLFKISHEVRHPVVQILGVSDLLEQQLIAPDELNVIMSAMRQSALLRDSPGQLN